MEDNVESKISYNDGNDIYGKKINNNNKIEIINTNINKNISNAYSQFKDNSATQLKDNLSFRRLIIITNLGKNLEDFKVNKNKYLMRSDQLNNKHGNARNIDDENTNDRFNVNSNNNGLLPMMRDQIENNELNERNKILKQLVGNENSSFLSNMKRDYLSFNDAVMFDKRGYCSILAHYLKLKQDFINIFCCSYSFAPYSIRFIKFLFFFLFLFYLETLCIGQKYYYDKHFSEEYKNFTDKMYNMSIINESIPVDNELNKNISFLEKYFTVKQIEFAKIHFLYTFKYAFPRILIPAAISLISYFFTSILSPRRKIMKAYLSPDLNEFDKKNKLKAISKKYKILYIIFGIIVLLLMVFFFYSITNYFFIFDDAQYDIPQSFLLSGLIRFIFDFLLLLIISNIRKFSIESGSEDIYSFSRAISEIN